MLMQKTEGLTFLEGEKKIMMQKVFLEKPDNPTSSSFNNPVAKEQ
jgi:hypothetical protein